MRRFVLTAVLLVGCHNELRPGRCNRTGDCAAGLVCDLSPTPQGNGRCVVPDGGPPDGDAGGSDGGGETGPECVRHSDCPADHPACSPSGTCVGCDAVANSCSERSVSKPVCGPAGACLECASDSDCTADATKPICDTSANACVGCSTDAQCAAKLGADPGVCMSHQDGRCATAAETIFVQNSSGCATSTGGDAGSVDLPFCTMQPAVIGLAGGKRLILVRGAVQAANYTIQTGAGAPQVTLVGQQTGAIVGGLYSALVVDTADIYARDIALRVSSPAGVIARNGATLRLENARVEDNPGGGILVDGAGFEIRNSTINRNGPATTGPTTWGGILVQNLPAGAPRELDLVTIQNNNQVGIACASDIQGNGVLASDNAGGVQASPTCQLTLCSPAGPDCGAQP
jgi:hypothetical protein